MHNEEIREAWRIYLGKMFEFGTDDPPWLFRRPFCGTCYHWSFIDEDGLHHLAVKCSPTEYDEIENDLSGKRIREYKDAGEIKDIYSDYRFYGWCRRFPPVQRNGYSILSFRSLFTFLSRHIPQKVAEYDFPLMPHTCSCGEWKKGDWVEDFVSENTAPKMRDRLTET